MTNHLANAASPYLLQHAENPVDWYPWGQEALEKARREDKPIFLSIGYAACHWCHVMAHESFEDPDLAALMNAHFINIKVDREERPDVDHIYMQAVMSMNGQGGWPLSVFLTPDLKPFYGGSYFPPTPRYGMPSFRQVIEGLIKSWRERRDEIEAAAGKTGIEMTLQNQWASSETHFTPDIMRTVSYALYDQYDWANGGWGEAPKFPQPMILDFLLRRHIRKDAKAYRVVYHALHSMARGGFHDVIGGGFHRYSTDRFWRVPHFEKMLYDNAQLARTYLNAYQIAQDDDFRLIAEKTLDFVLREMRLPKGGFAASLDADSEGEEGKFYVWTEAEILSVLPESEHEFFRLAYGLQPGGNWEGKTVLQRRMDNSALAQRFGMDEESVHSRLENCHQLLLSARAARPRPLLDDKVVTEWNGLMLIALAEAARALIDETRAETYLQAAQQNADFLLTQLWDGAKLYRTWRQGQRGADGVLADYAALILGLLALYQTDFDLRWYRAARQLTETMLGQFAAPEGGFYDTPAASDLPVRPQSIMDNAVPSGNALATEALLLMDAFEGVPAWREAAERALALVTAHAQGTPTGFGRWLCAADFSLGKPKQIAIMGDPQDQESIALRVAAQTGFNPNSVIAMGQPPVPEDAPTLLKNRPLLNNRATIYVCENFACKKPRNARK